MPIADPSKPRGILKPGLNPDVVEAAFNHTRLKPSPDLEFFIEHFWTVKWNIEAFGSHIAETLPHPSVHVSIDDTGSRVLGVVTGKFSRLLEGSGRVFGIKFRPATFYPFLGYPISRITDRALPLGEVFGVEGELMADAIRQESNEHQAAEMAENFFRKRIPERDLVIERVRDLVERIAVDRDLTRVEQVAALMGLSLRPLQRTFREYVGVTPKWVIQRYRLHEAAEQLDNDLTPDLTDLALQLGYFDQAHFIRDFKRFVGRSPAKYAGRVKESKSRKK